MFDLNQALLTWRNRLAACETCSPTDLDELEEHLREETHNLAANPQPLSDDEAFLLATARVNRPELAQPSPWTIWRTRLFWMVAGLLLYSFITAAASPIVTAAALTAHKLGLPIHYCGYVTSAIYAAAHLIPLLLIFTLARTSRAEKAFTTLTARPRNWFLFLGLYLAARLGLSFLQAMLWRSTNVEIVRQLQAAFIPAAPLITAAFYVVLAIFLWRYRPPQPGLAYD